MKLAIQLILAARKYWKYLIFGMLSVVGMTASQLYAPLVVRQLTNMAVNKDPTLGQKALSMGMILLAVYLVQAGCAYVRNYATHYAAWNFVADMRIRVYDKLQQLSLRYYHDKQTGQLMSRVVNDTANLETLIAHAVPDLIVNLVLLVGVTVIMFAINPTLTLLSIIAVPFLVVLSVWFIKKVRPLFRITQRVMGELNANLQDNLSGIKEIQVFNQQEFEKGKVTKSAQGHANAMLRSLRFSALYNCSIQFFSNMGTVLIITYGGFLAGLGKLPVADIVAFLLYLGIFYQPITNLATVVENLQSALAGAERVFEILDQETEVKEADHPLPLPQVTGRIDFHDVSFHYIEGMEVLRHIDLHINPGEMVALVGPTGVGKTTLVSLLNRFYDPSEGSIAVDGQDIREVSLRDLRDNMSNVLQDIFLFNGTVAENIAYGFPEATHEQVMAAAKVAHAHEFIADLEQGYDTMVGERGVKLSGGQKQRISIARAVLRDKPILILDEATASVDVETERLIHEAMDAVMAGRTTVIIAHRLSTVKKADKIVVLNEGVIEDIGTHEELVGREGLYAYLAAINWSTT